MAREKTKDRIIDVALDLFSSYGYDGTSIDAIAAAVGIKGPSIYSHFKSKEEIFEALLTSMEESYAENFGSISKRDCFPTNLEELKEDSLYKIKCALNDDRIRKIRKFCMIEQYRSDKVAKLTTKHQIEFLEDMYEIIFRNLMDSNHIKKEDPRFLAFEFIAPISLMVGVADREPEKLQVVYTCLEKHVDYFIECYKAE